VSSKMVEHQECTVLVIVVEMMVATVDLVQ